VYLQRFTARGRVQFTAGATSLSYAIELSDASVDIRSAVSVTVESMRHVLLVVALFASGCSGGSVLEPTVEAKVVTPAPVAPEPVAEPPAEEPAPEPAPAPEPPPAVVAPPVAAPPSSPCGPLPCPPPAAPIVCGPGTVPVMRGPTVTCEAKPETSYCPSGFHPVLREQLTCVPD
jgi:hypothetical protein